jgi:hypothetical protein
VSARGLTALLAAAALALVPAACGGDDGGGGATGGGASAEQLLERASKQTAKSADVKFELEASLKGGTDLEGPVKLTFSGPYRSNGAKTPPDLDWKLHAEGDGERFDARVVTTRDNAWVEYEGQTYEVGEQLISSLSAQLQSQQAEPQDLRSLGAGDWVEDPEVEDAEAGGVPTRRVSGDVDVRKVLESVDEVLQKSATAGQPMPRLTDRTMDEIEGAVETAHVVVDVGRDDGILRRNTLEVAFDVPEARRESADGIEGGDVRLLFEQSDVNGDQRVEAPSGARPISELLRGFGIPPEALLGPGFTPQSPG